MQRRKFESLGAVYDTSSRHRTVDVMVAGFRMEELVAIPDVEYMPSNR
ncbi:MAG: hypothetical protein KAW09_06230 [Thermoplasmata archaeon]|nr:hypothetical protein [Thermoplasmata archaeon]